MSLSPTAVDDRRALADDSPFMRNQMQLYRFLREGKSFSGHERNCCFLNQGDGSFADVSAISGFDFLDDARACGLADWDHDGDLDCWVTNRNSPRLRFLRNEAPGENDFLSIHLQGTTCNRDAIGAQVRVELVNRSAPPLIRTLRSGEGFIAQNSKWLSFGLGKHNKIAQIVVRWPGGSEETFTGISKNGRYELTQGAAPKLAQQRPAVRLDTAPAIAADSAPRPSGLLHRPLPMPEVPYVTASGAPSTFAGRSERPKLVNLWASWCRPCLAELSGWKNRHAELQAAELDLLTLCIDGLDNGVTADLAAIGKLATLGDRIELPGTAGGATRKTLDLLQLIHNQLFGIREPLPLPTSLLLSSEGDLAAVYKGPVDLDLVFRDLKKLRTLRSVSAPFAGQWILEPKYDPLFVVSKLVEQEYLDEARFYFQHHANRLVRGKRFADVVSQMGAVYVGREDYGPAEELFREAIEIDPGNAICHNDLAGLLQMRGELSDAIEEYRTATRLKPDNAAIRANLAAALILHKQIPEAFVELKRALQNDPKNVTALFQAAELLRLNKQRPEAVRQYEKALALSPNHLGARTNLGALLLETGKAAAAVEHLVAARELSPADAGLRKNLGLAFAITGKTELAIEEFRGALTVRPEDAAAHNNLGGLLIRVGQTRKAVEHFQAAVKLAPDHVKYRQNLGAAQQMLAAEKP